MEPMVLLVAGLVAGAAIGAIATWWLSRRKEAGGSVANLKAENERFKEEVTEHFVETARLINQLTDSYKAVFDHLSGGAEKLVDQEKLSERLPAVDGGEVRLYRIGAPDASDDKSKSSGPKAETKCESAEQPKSERPPESSGAAQSKQASDPASTESAGSGDKEKPAGAKPDSSASMTKPTQKTESRGKEAGSAESESDADSADSDQTETPGSGVKSADSDSGSGSGSGSGSAKVEDSSVVKPAERKDPLKKS